MVFSDGLVTIAIFIWVILLACDSNQSDPTSSAAPPSIVTVDTVSTELQKCTLFFFDTSSLRLAGEERELHLSQDAIERLKQIITALLGDSISGLHQTIPKGTVLYEVYIDERSTVYLDFSHHLKDKHIGGTTGESLTISAILRTIKANFPNQISKVQILIEGLETDTIRGHIDISKPLALSLELEVVSGVAESTGEASTEGASIGSEAVETEASETGQANDGDTGQ